MIRVDSCEPARQVRPDPLEREPELEPDSDTEEPVVLPELPELRDDGAVGLPDDASREVAAGATEDESLDLDDHASGVEHEVVVFSETTDADASWLAEEHAGAVDTLDVGVAIDPLDEGASVADERPLDIGLELEVSELPAMLGDGGEEGPREGGDGRPADDDAPPAGLPPIEPG